MLIDFTVENYRSIKGPVTLSAVANNRMKRAGRAETARAGIIPDEEIAHSYPVEGRDFSLLPVLGIFGANASGKSNVVKALDALLHFMSLGLTEENSTLKKFVPFRLNLDSAEMPTRFELRVSCENELFVYSLEVDQARIILERLQYAPPTPKRMRLLYERKWNSILQQHIWKNGDDFSGPHIQLENSLKEQEPFMALLCQRIKVRVVQNFTAWFHGRWPGLSLGNEDFDKEASLNLNHTFPTYFSDVFSMLKRFDTGLSSIEVKKSDDESSRGSLNQFQIFAYHETPEGVIVRWPFEEESIGTQRLFSLAHRIVHGFNLGRATIVDELGSNIHPNITREIVRLFQDPETNPNRAQLIFTSHDNTLQREQLLRRDQIWFTEKRADGSTDLFPLTDFKVRNDLAIDRAYLDGRFGAVPIISDSEVNKVEEVLR